MSTNEKIKMSTSKKTNTSNGWSILICAFFISFILDGCMYVFGDILNEIKDHYGVSQDLANLVQSFNIGFSFLCGTLTSALADKFGCRIVVIVSALIFGLMYLVSPFLPSIYFMIGTYGIIGGTTFGCCYLTCFIILVENFDKKLGLANGITMAGSGLGTFALAPITNIITKNYGWKISMISLGGLTFLCCLFGIFLKEKKKESPSVEMESLNNQSSDAHETVLEQEDQSKKSSNGNIIVEIFKEMFNFKLVATNKLFLLIVLSNFFAFFVLFIPFIYIPIRAKELGLIHYPWIVSIIGIVNIPSRIIFGVLSDKGVMSSINMNTLCSLMASAAIFSYYALLEFWMQAIFSVVYAISIAGINCLSTLYLVDILGPTNFGNANGILNMSRGIGSIVGPFIAGWLSETTGSSFYSFLFIGIAFLISFVFSGIVSIKLLRDSKAKSDNSSP